MLGVDRRRFGAGGRCLGGRLDRAPLGAVRWVGRLGRTRRVRLVLPPVPRLAMRSWSIVDTVGMGMGMNCGPMVRSMLTIQVLWFLFAQLVTLRPRL